MRRALAGVTGLAAVWTVVGCSSGGTSSTSASSSTAAAASSSASGTTGSEATTSHSASTSSGSTIGATTTSTSTATSTATTTTSTSSTGTAATTSGGATTSTSSGASGPTLVQHDSSSSSRNNGLTASPYCYFFQLPDFTTAGNAVVVGFTFGNNPTPSVSDDQGDHYTVVANGYDSTHQQSVGLAAAFDVAAGARVLSLCFSADPGGDVQPMATELANVVAIDGPGSTLFGSGTSVTAGSLTPTAAGDLVYQVAVSLALAQSSFTADPSGTLLSADLTDGWAGQTVTDATTSAINPTLTLGTSDDWLSAAVLLKAGQAGGVPSGPRIVHLVHENIPTNVPAGGNGTPFANPLKLQFPCSGNLVVAMIGGGNGPEYVTGVTDTAGNGWAQAGSNYNGGDATVQAFYAASAACSAELGLTIDWGATDGDYTIFFYDVTGAAAVPFDTANGATGNQGSPEASGDTLTMPYTFTPGTTSEIVFSEVMWDYNTGSALEGQLFDTNTFSGESVSGPEPVDENNGWGHVFTSGLSTVPVVWDLLYPNLATGAYAGLSVGFALEGAQSGPPRPQFLQVASATPQQPMQSVGATFTAQRAGDANVVVVGWNDATSTLPAGAVTDTAGNVYALAAGPVRSTNFSQAVYFAPGIAAATTNTVTVNFPNAVPYVDLRILEYSGIHAVDQTSGASGTTASASAPSLTTTAAPELIVVAATTAGTFSGPGSDYTQRILTTPDGDIAEDRVVTAVGTYPASAQQTGTAEWVLQAVSFQ